MREDSDETPLTDVPSTLSGWVVAIVKAIQAEGADVEPILKAAGISRDVLSDPEARIPISQTRLLWQLAVAATGNPAIGLKVPRHLTSASLFAIGTLMEVAPSFLAGLRHWLNYQSVISTGIESDCYCVGGNHYEILIRPLVSDNIPEAEDALVLGIVNMLRSDQSGAVVVEEVQLRRPRLEDVSAYEPSFQTPVRFSCDNTLIRFRSSEISGASEKVANPVLENAIQGVLADYLKRMREVDFLGRVRREIMRQLQDGEPVLEGVAENLHMSGRTLQRKLVARGSGYRQLVDEVRRELAAQLLVNTQQSVTDIAFRLGFSNASNFGRVFKRWSGVSPSEYRRENSEQDQ